MSNNLIFDCDDLTYMKNLMDHHKDYPSMLFGSNSNGEDIYLSINEESITMETHQENGCIRVNTYYKDGTVEETFRYD